MVQHGSNKERCVNWLRISFLGFVLLLKAGGKQLQRCCWNTNSPHCFVCVSTRYWQGHLWTPLDTERGCFVARTLRPGAHRLGCLHCGLGRHLFHNSADVYCPWLLRRGSRACRDAPFSLPGFPLLIQWTDFVETRTLWSPSPNKQMCLCSMEQEMASYRSGPFLTRLIQMMCSNRRIVKT